MKIYIILPWVILYFLSLGATAQELKEKDVPEIVRQKFNTLYPNMFVYEWEWEASDSVFEAEFMNNGKEMEAIFQSDGSYVGIEVDIRKEDLPALVNEAFSESEFNKWKIEDTEEFHSNDSEKLYLIEIERGKKKYKLYYSNTGKLVKTKKVK